MITKEELESLKTGDDVLPVNYNFLNTKQRKEVRQRYYTLQDGRCKHCSEHLQGPPRKDIQDKYLDMRIFPPYFLRHPQHLHHDHETGMTIGTVHARCNAVLWQYHGE